MAQKFEHNKKHSDPGENYFSTSSAAKEIPPTDYNERDRSTARDDKYSIMRFGEEFLKDIRELLVQQNRLLKQELREKVQIVKKSGMTVSVGLALSLIALQTLVAACVIGLAYIMPWWVSALVVGFVVLVIGIGMVSGGTKRMDAEHLKPDKSMATLHKMNEKLQEKFHEYKGH